MTKHRVTRRLLAVALSVLLVLGCVAPAVAATYESGTYTGTGTGRNGSVALTLTLTNGAIASVDNVTHSETARYWEKAKVLLDRLVGLQPPEQVEKLDAVTGATLSSNAIKEAAQDVFRQAESKETPVFASGSGTKSDPYLIRTAAQLQAFAAAVNGGYLVTPHVVDKITDTNGNVVEEIGTNIRRQVISESTSDVIRQMMEYEVGNGTGGGKNAYVSGYRIGGKSGTSEQLNMDRRADGDYKKVASFAAVLPADDPEILVYVMLDDPNNARTDYSSILAAPVAGNIISEVAPYLGIATDGEDRSQTTVTVPNLISTEWSNAQVQLNIKGLKHQLMESASDQTAALVTCQYPHAGAKVPYGTTVYLYTDTYDGSLTEVPDVSGKSADFARQMLAAAGLNCVVEGDANGVVQSQSSEVGASVQRGTIVTITCG